MTVGARRATAGRTNDEDAARVEDELVVVVVLVVVRVVLLGQNSQKLDLTAKT